MKQSQKPLFALMLGMISKACFRAQVKYGAIITDLKGSVGGHTFKGTAMGGVMQTKINRAAAGKSGGKITKADAGRLINPKRDMATNARAWRSLSASERLTWINAAPNFPFVNKYGETYTGSGFQLYMQCNNNLLAIGESAIAEAPPVETIDDMPAFTIAPVGGSVFSINTAAPIPAGYTVTVYAAFNQSAGRNYEPGRMKAIAQIDSTTILPYNLDSAYIAVFGPIPIGGVIWWSAKITKADAGRAGTPYIVQYIY